MPRNLEVLMAQAIAKARAVGPLPPLVLPRAFRGALPFDPGTGGWPRDLHMPEGMGLVTVHLWDEIGRPANEGAPELLEQVGND